MKEYLYTASIIIKLSILTLIVMGVFSLVRNRLVETSKQRFIKIFKIVRIYGMVDTIKKYRSPR